jgi:dihydrofolate reductase
MKPKIILYIASSLDGFIARIDGSVDWLDKYSESGQDYGYREFFESVDTVIVGNKTQKKFPQKYGDKTCFVFSRSSEGTDGNITYVKGDVKEFMKKCKLQGRIWLVGGADLIDQFLKYGLIDEFIISMMPEILGSGIPLFKTMDLTRLKLVKSTPYGNVMQVHYKK